MDDEAYGPTLVQSYGYVDLDPTCLIDNPDEEPVILYLLEEFLGHTKNIIHRATAYEYWKHNVGIQGFRLKLEDLQHAYDLAYGGGCEYEWES